MVPSELELVGRLVLSAVLGGLVGLEREISDQPAGFRTHMLVALGACLFALVSAYSFGAFIGDEAAPQFRFDPTRVAAQIVTGIGFLGAGAIIRYGMSVRGLTTAASLWVVAAVGTAVALGGYLIGGVTTLITIGALFGLKRLRSRLVRGVKKEHEEFIVEATTGVQVDRLVAELGAEGMEVNHLRVEDDPADEVRNIVLYVTVPSGRKPEQAVALLSGIAGVRNVDWTR